MDKKRYARYESFFREGSGLVDNNGTRLSFRHMTLLQKKQYVQDALLNLVDDFPEHAGVREFALFGKKELTGTMRDKLINVLYDEQIYMLFLTIVLSLFVYIVPGPKIPLPSQIKRREFPTEERF